MQNQVEQSSLLAPAQACGCRSPAGSWREPHPGTPHGSHSGFLPGFQPGFRAGGRRSCVPPFGFLVPGSGGVDASRRCISAPSVSADSVAAGRLHASTRKPTPIVERFHALHVPPVMTDRSNPLLPGCSLRAFSRGAQRGCSAGVSTGVQRGLFYAATAGRTFLQLVPLLSARPQRPRWNRSAITSRALNPRAAAISSTPR